MSSSAEQIKERLGVVEVVQSYVKLQRAGANFKANCPFHSEKTPSFFVSPAKGIWHCFGCGLTGDIFEFVKRIDGVEFPEALQILAERAGVEIKKEDPRLKNERTRLFQLLGRAALFYENQLEGRLDALNYLKERGLKPETIKNFRLGYALGPPTDGWRNVFNFLTSRGYKDSEIEKAGLAVSASGKFYDRFRGRIMFPIFDSGGKVVGFSGRIFPAISGQETGSKMPETAAAKYINTPQTILYDKSRILYGFDRAKNAIRQNDSCVLVEGQMDLIMCHQAGLTNTVAVSGTALTAHHLNLIGRLTNNLITAFDMDEAGSMATKRGIDLAIQKEFEVRVAPLPFGKDPADTAKESPAALKESFENSKHIIAFYLETLKKKFGGDIRLLKQQTGKIILPYLALIQSPIDRSHWVSEIAKNLGVREEPIWEEMKKRGNYARPRENYEKVLSEIKKRRDLLEERLIGIVLWKNKEPLNAVQGAARYFSDGNKTLLETIAKKSKMAEKDQNILAKLAFEAELLYSGMDNIEDEINSLIFELKREAVKDQLELVATRIKEAEKSEKKEELSRCLSEFQKLSAELSGFNYFQKNGKKNI